MLEIFATKAVKRNTPRRRFVLICVLAFNVSFLFDISRLQEDPPAGVSGAPSENNIMIWNAVIFG